MLRFHVLGRYRKRLGLGFVAGAAIAPPKRSDRRVTLLRTANPPLGRAAIATPAAVCKVPAAVSGQYVVPPEADQAVGTRLAFDPVHTSAADQAVGVLRTIHVLEMT